MLERVDAEVKIEINTILKLAKLAVEKYSQTSSQPGFITTQNGQKIKVKFSELADALGELMEKDLAIVRRCKDCDNFNKAPHHKVGNCFPKSYDRQRRPEDFCSKEYITRSIEMRNIDEAVTKLLSKERAGDDA